MHARILLFVGVISVVTVTPCAAQVLIRQQAPSDRAADFPSQVLANEIARMEAEGISTVRLLEGGTHNTNIRHDEHVTPDTAVYRSHPRGPARNPLFDATR